jgi:sirohydrochlorin ferrochelatase
LAARIAQRLKAGGNQKDKTAIFLVAHGHKQDICPSPEMQQLRTILSHHLDHDEIYNVQIDGQPSLVNWRNMIRCRNALFVPLMTGDGVHCRIDIPASVNSRSDEKVGMLASVGTWWELSSLLADHVNCGRHHRRNSFQPSQSARTEFGAGHVTS